MYPVSQRTRGRLTTSHGRANAGGLCDHVEELRRGMEGLKAAAERALIGDELDSELVDIGLGI